MPLYPSIKSYFARRKAEFESIPERRRNSLDELTRYVRDRVADRRPSRLTFICTHNSRRSQIAQCWAQAAAVFCDVEGVEAYSGGTEATAFNPRAVRALRRAGFEIVQESESNNPFYLVRYSDAALPLRAFSKVYDRSPNPDHGFCSVMTCSTADANCPVVSGASNRVAIPYDDPGEADGTRREVEAYDGCCRRISREMLYLFSGVSS